MTKEEVDKIPFKFISHMNFGSYGEARYMAKVNGHIIVMTKVGVIQRESSPVKRSSTSFVIDGKPVGKKKAFYKAMESIN